MASIIPALLTDQLATAEKQLGLARQSEAITTVEIDVVDGWYADNVTLVPSDYVQLALDQLQIQFHLMTEDPLDYVFEIVESGDALSTATIIAQVERMTSQPTFVDQVKQAGFQVGLALDLYTPAAALEPSILNKLDFVTVMGIEAGFQGQVFAPVALDTVAELVVLRKTYDLQFQLVVDGGVTLELAPSILAAGADHLAVGSALWTATDFLQQVAEFAKL